MVSQMKTSNMFYLVIYWKQKVHYDLIFLCSIVLPPIGHSSNHEWGRHLYTTTAPSCCIPASYWYLSATLQIISITVVNFQDSRAVFRIFIPLLRFSSDCPSFLIFIALLRFPFDCPSF